MQFSYTLTEDDFVRAGLLMLRRKQPLLRFLPWFFGVVLAVVILPFILHPAELRAYVSDRLFDTRNLGLLIPIFFFLLPWMTRHALRKQFRKMPILGETRQLRADFSGLHFRAPSASSDIEWSVFIGYAEDRYNFLIIQQGNLQFVPIPKRALTEMQVEQIRSTFQIHLPKK